MRCLPDFPCPAVAELHFSMLNVSSAVWQPPPEALLPFPCPETPQSRLVYSAQSSLEGRMGTSAGCPAVVHSFLHLSPSHFFSLLFTFIWFCFLFHFHQPFVSSCLFHFKSCFSCSLFLFSLFSPFFPFLDFVYSFLSLPSFFLVCPCPSFFLIFLFLLFNSFFSFFTKFSIFPLLTPDFPFFHNIFDFLSWSGTFSSFFPIFCLHFLLPDLSVSFYSSWFFSVLFSLILFYQFLLYLFLTRWLSFHYLFLHFKWSALTLTCWGIYLKVCPMVRSLCVFVIF